MKKKVPQPKYANKPKADSDDEKPIDSDQLEAELSGFEQLLTEVMTFKETTASWSRNERLAYAEKFASKYFVKFIYSNRLFLLGSNVLITFFQFFCRRF